MRHDPEVHPTTDDHGTVISRTDARRLLGAWLHHEHTGGNNKEIRAHIKASLLGPSLSMPVSRGRLAVGTWQGIYLCEHRDRGGARSLVATLQGE